MAVIDKLKVCITIDGVPLPEYNDPIFDPDSPTRVSNEVTRYVEARPGAFFSVHIELLPSFNFRKANSACCDLFIDGGGVYSSLFVKDASSIKNGLTRVASSHEYGTGTEWFEKLFRFDTLTHDDCRLSCDQAEDRPVDFGEIEVQVWRYRSTGIDKEASLEETSTVRAVSKKFLKRNAIECSTTLTTATRIEPLVMRTGWRLGTKPVATFKFRYRSRRALEVLGVIEPPIPLHERDPTQLTLEETVQVIEFYKQREETRKTKVKKEKQDANLDQLEGLKRSRASAFGEDDSDSDIEEIERPVQFMKPKPVIHHEIL